MPRRFEEPKAKKRHGHWYFVRRVPAAFTDLDKRRDIYASTGIRITDDPRGIAAASAVAALNYAAERYWKNLKAGHHDDWARSIEEDQVVGQKNGLLFQLSNELLNTSPPSELLQRPEGTDEDRRTSVRRGMRTVSYSWKCPNVRGS